MIVSLTRLLILSQILIYQVAYCQFINQPKLEIENREYLVNNEIDISVAGLLPNQKFILRAITYDQRERPWIASAKFQADDNGSADIKNIEPISGTYSGKDVMGLFWSALFRGIPLDSATNRGTFSRRSSLTYKTTIELEVDNKKIDSTDIYRSFLSKDVKADTLNHELLEGILYRPSNSKVDGIVIVLAGSDGGITSADWRASLLASNGIPSLALAFFDYKNLPQDLIELPLEYLSNAIGYLKETENFEKVGLMGFSKGSELVLAYCSKVPDNTIDAIIAISPSAYIWQGINSKVDVKSSWTYQKLPLDFIPWKYNEEVIKMLQSDGPKKFRTLYEYSLMASDNQENVIKAALDLGYSDAPVLLIAGTDDGSWPAAEMVNKLSEKLIESNYKNKFEKLILDEAGHLIFFDFLPVTDSQKQSGQIFGGTIEANIGARKKAWNYVYSFLLQEMN